MIIEHAFITTLEAQDALGLAHEYLAGGGFAATNGAAPPSAPGPSRLDVTRGRANAARAKSIDELPQRMTLEWDRGRVTVAVLIEYFQAGSFTAGSRREPPAHSPKLKNHVELMYAVIGGLEAVLARRLPVDEARRPWAELEARLRDESLRKRRRHYIILWSIFAALVLLVVLVVVASAG